MTDSSTDWTSKSSSGKVLMGPGGGVRRAGWTRDCWIYSAWVGLGRGAGFSLLAATDCVTSRAGAFSGHEGRLFFRPKDHQGIAPTAVRGGVV